MKKQFILPAAIVAILVVGLGGFAGGMQFQKSKDNKNESADRQGQNAQQQGGLGNQMGGRMGGQRPISGAVASVSTDKMTVTTQSGTTNVTFSGNTQVSDGESNSSKSVSDIKTGYTVMVMGSTGSDGTVTAQRVVINPSFNMQGSPPSGDQGQDTQFN